MVAQPFEIDELKALAAELKERYNKSNGQDQKHWHDVSVYQLETEYLLVTIHAQTDSGDESKNTRFLIYKHKDYATTQLMKQDILATRSTKDKTRDLTYTTKFAGCERLADDQLSQLQSTLSKHHDPFKFKLYPLHNTADDENKDAGVILIYWEKEHENVHFFRIFPYFEHETTESFISEVETFASNPSKV